MDFDLNYIEALMFNNFIQLMGNRQSGPCCSTPCQRQYKYLQDQRGSFSKSNVVEVNNKEQKSMQIRMSSVIRADPNEKIQIRGYTFDIQSKEIGQGAYGMVYIGRKKELQSNIDGGFTKKRQSSNIFEEESKSEMIKKIDRDIVAVKVMRLDQDVTQDGELEPQTKKIRYEQCLQELFRQQLVKSQGVVDIFDYSVLKVGRHLNFAVVCEYMDEGHLKINQNGFQYNLALSWLKKILVCYRQLYKKGMAHRDLKPQNILMNSSKQLKITDFGAAMQKTYKAANNQHTPDYAAPQQRTDKEHTQKCDVYAIGCIFFKLLFGMTPKDAACVSNGVINQKNFNKKCKKKKIQEKSAEYNFLKGCLQGKEEKRLSWEQVYLHPIFQRQFNNIVRQVAEQDILLTIFTYSTANDKNIIKDIERFESATITKDQLSELLKKNDIPDKDLDRLQRMNNQKQENQPFKVKQLVNKLQQIKQEKFSDFPSSQTKKFLTMFDEKQKTQTDKNTLLFKGIKKNNQLKQFINSKLQTEAYKKQKQIILGTNHKLESLRLPAFPPFPLLPQVEKIILWSCQIQSLDVQLNAPKLKTLSLKSNQIQKIIRIQGCSQLTYLDLSSNKLRSINGLQRLGKLKKLDVSMNRLTEFSNIGHLKNLEILNLSSNRIRQINGLKGNTKLTTLFLNDNLIELLNENLLELSVTIKTIYLYGNRIDGKTKQNQHIFNKFTYKYKQAKLYLSLSGTARQSKFEKVYKRVATIQNKQYRILSLNDKEKGLSFLRKYDQYDVENQVKIQKIETDQPKFQWTIQLYKSDDKDKALDEYCIMPSIQNKEYKQFLSWSNGKCSLTRVYLEGLNSKKDETGNNSQKVDLSPEQKQRNEEKIKMYKQDSAYRWVFEDRRSDKQGQDNKEPYYSICNVQWRQRIAIEDDENHDSSFTFPCSCGIQTQKETHITPPKIENAITTGRVLQNQKDCWVLQPIITQK